MKNKYSIVVLTLFLAVITFPVILGWVLSGNYVFGGFIANPVDGQSYLAKMNEGFNGAWLFQLSFSSHPGNGQPLFLLYIFLGHLSKLFNLPLILVFHAARVISALFLAYSLWVFIKKCVPIAAVNRTWVLLLFGSGMGWLLLIFSKVVPIDFYVAEMYPFLSAYTNPHFPLGLAILLWIFIGSIEYQRHWRFIVLFVGGLLLSIILQFGIVLYLSVYGILFIWVWIKKERISFYPILAVLSGGGVWLLYQFYIIRTDPTLSLWDAQNVTAAPDLLNLFLGIFPLIVLIIVGYRGLFSKNLNSYVRLSIIWLITGILITYIPFNLQRRFLTGLYIPAGILGVLALDYLPIQKFWKTNIYRAVFCLAVVSNLLLGYLEISALNQKENVLFLKQSEYNGLLWMRDNVDKNTVVLASPNLSLFIPGISGENVVYGHPLETIHADSQKAQVEKFFNGQMGPTEENEFLTTNQVRFVVYGPSEKTTGSIEIQPGWNPVYSENDLVVYEIN